MLCCTVGRRDTQHKLGSNLLHPHIQMMTDNCGVDNNHMYLGTQEHMMLTCGKKKQWPPWMNSPCAHPLGSPSQHHWHCHPLYSLPPTQHLRALSSRVPFKVHHTFLRSFLLQLVHPLQYPFTSWIEGSGKFFSSCYCLLPSVYFILLLPLVSPPASAFGSTLNLSTSPPFSFLNLSAPIWSL